MTGPVSRTLVIMMNVKGTAARAEAVTKAGGGDDAPAGAPRKVTIGIPRSRSTAITGPSGPGKPIPLHYVAGAGAGTIDADRTFISDAELTRFVGGQPTRARRNTSASSSQPAAPRT